ncbi:RICIN domain-containing protein [Kitasatospora sp. NPDC015120]|uniref:RICIN domain-containing protein n=1 Tax=Kitasatospora sp. NPDC015120 TaxID=3364023 RepID=UPI0036F49FAE
MNGSRRVGRILAAAAAALTLGAGPAVAVGQPAAGEPAASVAPGSTLAASAAAAGPAGAVSDYPPRTFTLTSNAPEADGRCLDVWDWGNGPWVQMWGCHGGANQSWNVSYNAVSGGYQIQSNASGKCVDGYRGRGQQVVQLPCDNSASQAWTVPPSAGRLRFVNRAFPGSPPGFPGPTGQCLDIYDWGRGTVVQLWDCGWGQGNQEWWYN